MKTLRKLTRRSFLGQVAGNAVGAGALALIGTSPAVAAQPACSDTDRGANADPSGEGRRCGATDNDPADAAGSGRGGRSGATDNDPSDPSGEGRGNGCSDRDSGRGADPMGRGRRCGAGWTGITDTDSGPDGDRANYGRRGGANPACSDRDSGLGADPAGRGRLCGGGNWVAVTGGRVRRS